MPYPRHLLHENEVVALDLRPHWWFFSRHILTGVPLVALIIVIVRMSDSTGEDIASWVILMVAVVWSVWLALKYLSWTFTHFVVTNQRVIYRTGVLSRHGVEIPSERINNINFNQSIWERIIGAGNLEIQSAGEEGTSQFQHVRHPDGVQQEIYRQIESSTKKTAGLGADAIGDAVAKAMAGRQDAGAAGVAGVDHTLSIPEQIEQLAALRDRGIISAEEFEHKKAQLLERM